MEMDKVSYKPPADQSAWLGSEPIPAKAYYDPEYYELERRAIFMRSWMVIGHVSELPEPGSFIKRELEFARASILIVRGKDGEIRGFHNVCTHRGTQIEDRPSGKASAFNCPYHKWSYSLDGALRSAPDFERFFVSKADCALKRVSVDVCGGLIFLNLERNPALTLKEYLGDHIVERLQRMPVAKATDFCEYVYETDANWKMVYDNFQESYHLKFIHPRTGAAAYTEENPFGYPENLGFHGPHRSQQFYSGFNPNAITPVQAVSFPLLARYATERGLMPDPTNREYYALFPAFFIFGSPTQHFSHVVYPISATRSRGVIRIYWVGEEKNASERFAREYCLAIAREVHAEDVHVIRAGQRGLSSGALEYIHFQALEGLCRHLYLMSKKMVEAYKAEQTAEGAAS